MNHESNDTLTISIAGDLTIPRHELEPIIQQFVGVLPGQPTVRPIQRDAMPQVGGKAERMAHSVKETAEVLGVGPMTVNRLMYRGLLKPSLALRTKLIAKSEVERFLKSTTSEF